MSPSASIAFPSLRDLPAAPAGPGFSRSPGTTPGHVLPAGTRLRDYEITGLIGEGGFGIVYLALDHSLQRKVAIKEYMPASMVSRVAGSSAIVIKSERHLDPFKAGLKSFVNEARLLARFDHPSLVKVYRFWEENGTAYMVMPFYEGPTLKTALAELGHVPSEAELRTWLEPLLDALAVMHAARCFHRDIAPDNILLTPIGPLLLDFGAARRVIGGMTHALTVVLKPGYAPIEQYGDVASMAQGAWTDLYALACVVYYAITGRTPMSSVERLMDDRLEPIAMEAKGRYGDAFLRAIDAALSVRPSERPQDAARFRALLDADRGKASPAPKGVLGVLQLRDSIGEIPDRVVTTVPRQLMPVLATEIYVRAPEPSVPVDDPAPLELTEPPEPTLLMPRPLPEEPAVESPPRDAWPAPLPTPVPIPTPEPVPTQTQTDEASVAVAWIDAPTVLQPRAVAAAPTTAWGAEPVAGDGRAGALEPEASPPAGFAEPEQVARRHEVAMPRRMSTTIAVTLACVALGGLAAWAWQMRDADKAARVMPPASPLPITAAPSLPSPLPSPSPQTATAALGFPTDPAPASSAAPASSVPSATTATEAAVTTTMPTVDSTPSVSTSAPRPRRATPAARVQPEPDTARETTPVPHRASSTRCSDILQKASLEPLTAEEAAYLKKECR